VITFGPGARVLCIAPRLTIVGEVPESCELPPTAWIYAQWSGGRPKSDPYYPKKDPSYGNFFRIPNPEICPICWSSEADPCKVSCGHSYCSECFEEMCASAETPIQCVGMWPYSLCDRELPMTELHFLLGPKKFEALLKRAINQHVQQNSEIFRYCPTPDCPQIHRTLKGLESSPSPTPQGKSKRTSLARRVQCGICPATICLQCETLEHEGVTCQQQKRRSLKNDAALGKWKEGNKGIVRDCPKCGCSIEMNDGCMHMKCYNCKQHFCWTCLTMCESARDTDIHIQVVHFNNLDVLNEESNASTHRNMDGPLVWD
jgi:hypothetical protein